MKETIILIIKGFIIGIGKVLPGVSGSLIALSLGLYEKAIEAISNIFNDFKNNVIFLSTIGVGILLSVMIGSNIVNYFLNNHYMPTMFLFIGLILGSSFDMKDKIKRNDYKIVITITIISISLFVLKTDKIYVFNHGLKDYIYLFVIGLIDAATMVIPGISGTAIFMILGCYNMILYIFGHIFEIALKNPLIIMMIGSGILIGIILTSKLMNYLFKNNNSFINSIILGFSISSICYLFIETINSSFTFLEILIGTFLLVSGYVITKYKMNKI